ncbi:MAG: MBL fold metallo-hydrolase [Colwellia sp.]|nr:MBL fold metallo-hydrolase [Colwellia sp.]
MGSLSTKCFFDEITNTATYLIADKLSKKCAVIDSVLNFDPYSATTSTVLADQLITYVKEQDWQCMWILETHAHADHLTAAPYLQEHLGGKIAIGRQITAIQTLFKPVFNLEESFATDGSQFDQLLNDEDILPLGNLSITVLHTPGHTPGCVSYVIENAAFIGDTLFMPDYGTARCDFPGGDASTLYQSIQKILALPSNTQLFTGHDYKAPNRDVYAWQSSVAEQKQQNIHIHERVTIEEFITFRKQRDASLSMPKLILPAVQINIRAGHLPPVSENGRHYLSLPLNAFGNK